MCKFKYRYTGTTDGFLDSSRGNGSRCCNNDAMHRKEMPIKEKCA